MTFFTRYKPLVDDWQAFQEALQRPLPTTIWANPTRIDPAQLPHLLPANLSIHPLPWLPGAFRLPADFSPGLHWAYLAGLYHVQEEVSLLPVYLLDPQPGERVLDLCAAPGNKTAQISVAMRNLGTAVANDRNPGRMRAARQTLDRLGLLNVSTTIYDGGNLTHQAGPFAKILVDAPCTCEGTCRKDASVLHNNSSESLKMVGAQKALLRKAVQLCQPGGRIAYATCTFAPEENELVVDAILRDYGPGIVRLLPARVPGFTTSPGLTHWQGKKFKERSWTIPCTTPCGSGPSKMTPAAFLWPCWKNSPARQAPQRCRPGISQRSASPGWRKLAIPLALKRPFSPHTASAKEGALAFIWSMPRTSHRFTRSRMPLACSLCTWTANIPN